jgi:uncharacterized protein YqfA (UPF0365 family)
MVEVAMMLVDHQSVVLPAGVALVAYLVPVGVWLAALFSGVRVPLSSLVGMRLRRVKPAAVVRPLIAAAKAGVELDLAQMEAHHLAGGRVEQVAAALIRADRSGVPLTWQQVARIDLAGRSVADAVEACVEQRVLETPHISGVAKDGTQVVAVADVTLRGNIDRFAVGASEPAVIARVRSAAVSAIGAADSHRDLLADPAGFARRLLEQDLAAGAAFDILAIDFTQMRVGHPGASPAGPEAVA